MTDSSLILANQLNVVAPKEIETKDNSGVASIRRVP